MKIISLLIFLVACAWSAEIKFVVEEIPGVPDSYPSTKPPAEWRDRGLIDALSIKKIMVDPRWLSGDPQEAARIKVLLGQAVIVGSTSKKGKLPTEEVNLRLVALVGEGGLSHFLWVVDVSSAVLLSINPETLEYSYYTVEFGGHKK